MNLRFGTSLRQINTQSYISSLKAELFQAQRTAATGLAVETVSDAPHLWGEIGTVEDAILDTRRYMENSDQAGSILSHAETSLDEAHNIVTRVTELAVAYSSEVYSAADRQLAADEVDGLLANLVTLGNTELGGRYVFAGTAYDTPPFDDVGTYLGNGDQPSTRIGTDNWVHSGFDGDAMFRESIDALVNTAAALRTGDHTQVANQLDVLDSAGESLIRARQQVGNELRSTQDAREVAENLELVLSERHSDITAADPYESYSRLVELQSSYDAALQVTASTMRTTLFDYTR